MMLRITPAMVATKPGHQGEREGIRKSIAQGMPVEPGKPVATTRCIFCTNHGCIGHPAFPAPSVLRVALRPLTFWGERNCKTSDKVCRENATPYPAVIARLDRASEYSRALMMNKTLWYTGSPAFTGDDGSAV